MQFYSFPDSRFAQVESGENIIFSDGCDGKACTDTLTIVKELSFWELISEVVKESVAINKTIVTNMDHDSIAAAAGTTFSISANTGRYSVASNSSKLSVAVSTGISSQILKIVQNSIINVLFCTIFMLTG